MLRSVVLLLLLTSTVTAQEKPGVVFIAGGAGGIMNLAGFTRWALRQVDSKHEVREFEWTHGTGRVVRDIQDIRHLAAKADELTEQVQRYHSEHPDRPIYLIGRSTGAMIVLQVAEKLPAETLERIILLSPAVSPKYDLQMALQKTRTEIVSFHSSLDIAVLNWATTLVGTADRYYTKCAGLNGFTLPPADTPAANDYQRLRQIAWSPSKVWYGHLGGHFGNGMPLFLLYEVMPFLDAGKK